MVYSKKNTYSPFAYNTLSTDGYCINEKYYVNGVFIDLCGLSIEDYMNNNCSCNNGAKPTNEIIVKTFTDDNGIIYYQAFAKFAVSSNLKIVVSSTTDIVTELDLFTGDIASKPEIGDTLDYIKVDINIPEDNEYEYIAIKESEKMIYDVYYSTVLLSNARTFDGAYTKLIIKENTSHDMKFIIPSTDINYNNVETIEEFNEFCQSNQYCLQIFLPKNVYDNKKYIITNYGGIDITNKFKFSENRIINEIEYVCIIEKGNNDITPFIPLYNEELIYEYKLTINK